MPEISVEFNQASAGWPEGLDVRARQAVAAALGAADIEIAGPVEVSVLLTDDAAQKQLNKRWRGKDSATNVLSFPQADPFAPLSGLIGDLSLARETIAREAAGLGKPFADHFTHLVVHGTLHLCGYDHIEDDEALVMERLETDILAQLGVADPYDGQLDGQLDDNGELRHN